MSAPFTWMAEDNPLPTLERKWQDTGALSTRDIQLLQENRALNPDIRIRESCRVFLAAVDGQTSGEPHAQHLVRLRNLARFRSKIRRAQKGVQG